MESSFVQLQAQIHILIAILITFVKSANGIECFFRHKHYRRRDTGPFFGFGIGSQIFIAVSHIIRLNEICPVTLYTPESNSSVLYRIRFSGIQTMIRYFWIDQLCSCRTHIFLFQRRIEECIQPALGYLGIVIEKQQIFAPRDSRSIIIGFREGFVFRILNHGYVKFIFQAFHIRSGVIRRCIVDHNNFKIAVKFFFFHGRHQSFQMLFPVSVQHNNGDHGIRRKLSRLTLPAVSGYFFSDLLLLPAHIPKFMYAGFNLFHSISPKIILMSQINILCCQCHTLQYNHDFCCHHSKPDIAALFFLHHDHVIGCYHKHHWC